MEDGNERNGDSWVVVGDEREGCKKFVKIGAIYACIRPIPIFALNFHLEVK